MINLDNFSLGQLLNERVVFSKEDIALADSVGEMLSYIYKKTQRISYNDTIPSFLLDHIAAEEHVDFYDKTFPDDVKRKLIDQSEYLHTIKGTVAAIKAVLEIVGMKGDVLEWFQYGGEPYNFKIEIENTTILKSDFERTRKLVEAMKNLRSQLEDIIVKMPVQEITITHQTAAGQYPIPITNTFYTAPTVGKALENIASIEHITVGGTYPILATGAFYTS